MTDNPDKSSITKVIDQPHAPIVFFDDAPAFNNYNGIIGITLTAGTIRPAGEGKITNEQIVVAYLRGNIQALMGLRAAINDALLLGAKTDGQTN